MFCQHRDMRLALVFTLFAAQALADDPLDAAAFEALVEGKTLTFSVGGAPYGIEYYAPNRRVVWSFVGGECTNGDWYEVEDPSGPVICFEYESTPTAQCWQIFEDGGKIRADFMNEPGTTVLYEAVEAEPLVCGGVGA